MASNTYYNIIHYIKEFWIKLHAPTTGDRGNVIKKFISIINHFSVDNYVSDIENKPHIKYYINRTPPRPDEDILYILCIMY